MWLQLMFTFGKLINLLFWDEYMRVYFGTDVFFMFLMFPYVQSSETIRMEAATYFPTTKIKKLGISCAKLRTTFQREIVFMLSFFPVWLSLCEVVIL